VAWFWLSARLLLKMKLALSSIRSPADLDVQAGAEIKLGEMT
jgi:hypothetical protein